MPRGAKRVSKRAAIREARALATETIVRVWFHEKAEIYHENLWRSDHQVAVTRFHAKDQALFRSRWDHLGAFRDP